MKLEIHALQNFQTIYDFGYYPQNNYESTNEFFEQLRYLKAEHQ